MTSRCFVAVLLAALGLFGLPYVAAHPLFVFGDSYLDTGNNDYLDTPAKANMYPNGIDFKPESGRFSNGRVITDFLAEYIGVQSPPPSLSEPEDPSAGVNFASGGAGILATTNAGQTLSLLQHLASFLDLVHKGQISEQAVSEGVYLIHIGANDLFNLPTNASAVPPYVMDLVKGYILFLEALLRTGARKVIRLALGPLGCDPAVRARLGTSPPSLCYEPLNKITVEFNGAVSRALSNPTGELAKLLAQAHFVTYDQYAAGLNYLAKLRIAAGPEALNACCGAPPPLNGLVPCGQTLEANGTTLRTTFCGDRDRHFFWDWVHPSQETSQVSSRDIWEGGPYTNPSLGAKSL